MISYFLSLSIVDRFFLICACVGGLLFLVRTVLQLFGGDSDIDADADFGDMDLSEIGGDSDASFHILSLHGLTVFFLMFGLTGLTCSQTFGLTEPFAIIGALIVGILSFWIIASIMSLMTKLQSSGNINIKSAIGQKGTVYLTIPKGGTGKVQLVVQERLKVLDAVAEDKKEIKTNENVEVIDELNEVLIVKKI
jgi:membrane protein implicated in regulation of membrane protease activity